MLIVLSRLGNPTMVGKYALALAIAAPVYAVANMQLRNVQVTHFGPEYRFVDYFSFRLLTISAASLLIVLIGLLAGFEHETSMVILAVCAAKACEWTSDIIFGLAQKCLRLDLEAKSRIVRGLFGLIALGAGTTLTDKVSIGIFSMALVWLAVLAFYDIPKGILLLNLGTSAENRKEGIRALRPRWSLHSIGPLLWQAFPLGLASGVHMLNLTIPRYAIAGYEGEAALGIFAAIYYFGIAGTLTVGAFGQALMPRMSRDYSVGDVKGYRRNAGMVFLLAGGWGVGLVAVATVAGEPILAALYGPAFSEHSGVFVLMMWAILVHLLANSFEFLLTTIRQFRVLMGVKVLQACYLAPACLFLVPAYGLEGAALAILSAAGVSVVLFMAIIPQVPGTRDLFTMIRAK
jgi:O-antigen/teichoic acid export membrane protein